ncbi:MAG TPA: hypothetical protein VEH27_13910 [Methylomirabilota bacterium]|nr:hypothetical protein [Methylomirabilota bacterium]
MKLYVASSWRNEAQQGVVASLRNAGHEVYDFKNPKPGNHGFHWSAVDPDWKAWSAESFRSLLKHPIAEAGFSNDWNAMLWADAGVLVLPSGRSAHIEAGYFVGAKKPLIILLAEGQEPELMYKMATTLCLSIKEVLSALDQIATKPLSEAGERYKERFNKLDADVPHGPFVGMITARRRL